VETLLKKRDVAALIMEPIICNLGALVPDVEFVRGVRKLCTRYGTLFIADEVATGFGRTESSSLRALRSPARRPVHGQGHHRRLRRPGRRDHHSKIANAIKKTSASIPPTAGTRAPSPSALANLRYLARQPQ